MYISVSTERLILFKVTVHLERCFQFSVYNSVNTHRIPTKLQISLESLCNYLNDGVKIV